MQPRCYSAAATTAKLFRLFMQTSFRYGFRFQSLITRSIFSSPEPLSLSRPLSSVCVYACCMYVNNFKHLLLWNHWADWSQISCEAFLGRAIERVQTVLVTWPTWPPCPYTVKTLKIFFSGPKGRWLWNLVCSIECSNTTKFVQMMTLGWPWPILRQGQIWSLMLLYGKKVKQWIFQKLLLSVIWN